MTDSVAVGVGNPICVLADHREMCAPVLEALRAMEGVETAVTRLSVGDYQVDDTFVFERKTLPDLAMSIQDGRLFRQTRVLASLPPGKRGVLVLEGTSADLADSAMRREAIQGALITVTVFFGIPLLRAVDAEECARLMVYAARQARYFTVGALPRHGKRPRGKRKAQLALLQDLPGVGPERAQRLLDRFGSVEAVLTAAVEDLTEVEGVGKRTARGIRWIVQEPRAAYGAPVDIGTPRCIEPEKVAKERG